MLCTQELQVLRPISHRTCQLFHSPDSKVTLMNYIHDLIPQIVGMTILNLFNKQPFSVESDTNKHSRKATRLLMAFIERLHCNDSCFHFGRQEEHMVTSEANQAGKLMFIDKNIYEVCENILVIRQCLKVHYENS